GDTVCFVYCLVDMRGVDVVVAATSSGQTLLVLDDIENLMEARRNRPLLLIDLSVPRNIDPAASQLENVTLYNIDDLEALARAGLRNRQRELATCHKIIEAHVQALVEKLDSESERIHSLDRVHASSLASHHIAEQEETTCCVVNVAREFKHTVLPSYTE